MDIAAAAVSDIIATLPDGHARVVYRQTRYGLTVTRFNGGRSLKIRAEELGGRDVISANFYSCASGVYVMPCEMTQAKVQQFLLGLQSAVAPSMRADSR